MIAPGTRLGPYEVTAQIGAGGMGEVYRATDTKLGREVAIKVLPVLLAHDADRLARFDREARTLATLNHPNIAAIHGLEDADGVKALVMELIEGPTLADRIAHGRLPVDEALAIARQIAEALETAHEQGIVHRDLKPANIKVRDDGTVKVLDFGLAKVVEPVAAMSSNQSMSPTITTPAMTQMGVILGTAAYMAPEQAKGRPADKRSDVWAFGCVLYEMLTGRRAFEGEDLSDTLANILKSAPDWTLLPADVPATVRTLVTMCLEKDRKRRIGEASVAKFLLSENAGRALSDAPPGTADAALTPVQPRRQWRSALVFAALLLVGSVAGAATVWVMTRPTPPLLARFEVMTRGSEALALGGLTRDIAISPDGTKVVYRSASSQLFVRPIDQLKPTLLTASATFLPANPFFSPDGQWVGFHTPIGVWKVAVTGGPSLLISQLAGVPRGASWGPDGTIVFAKEGEPGLRRVSAAGGDATVLTKPDPERGEASHIWPEFLPGGRAMLFTIEPPGRGAGGAAQIAVLDLETGMSKILLRGGSDARYAPSGHLVYTAAGTLRAVPFDLDRLEVSGAPVPVIPDVATTGAGGANFALADNGTLAYAPAGTNSTIAGARTLVWVDRQGREERIDAPPRSYLYPRLSPDGTRVALDIRDEQSDIWLLDLTRNTLRRVTYDPGIDQFPVWTSDGSRIVFSTSIGGRGGRTISSQAADGSGSPEPLSQNDDKIRFPTAVSPDGTRLIVMETDSGATGLTTDILALRLDKNGEVEPLIQTNAGERNAEISPNGRWLAYQSDESGRLEVYVRPFPDVNSGQTQVSNGGGWPLWSRDGQELFYLGPDRAVMSTRVEPRNTWTAASPTKIIDNPYLSPPDALFGRTYDVSPDGKRFLMIKPAAGQTSSFILVQNWLEELRRLVPR